MNPPISLTITEIKGDVYKITAKARMTDIGNKTFPNETYRLPNLWDWFHDALGGKIYRQTLD